MFYLSAYLWGLAAIMAVMLTTWLVSLYKNDASIADSVWGAAFMVAAVIYAISVTQTGPRTALVLILVIFWGIRLTTYITWRNWGEPEDRRYRELRANRSHFGLRSLYLVFGLQGTLAWLISLPLLAAIASSTSLNVLDYLGIGLWLVGMVFEVGGDYQLARFKSDPANEGEVMCKGLWRYTRHPNYFGDFCVWWGLYLIALAAGGWWSIISPIMMTILLLKVSGVTMAEKISANGGQNTKIMLPELTHFFLVLRANGVCRKSQKNSFSL